jgi:outer membrane protein assembly factor BamD (BamD/ComL family)
MARTILKRTTRFDLRLRATRWALLVLLLCAPTSLWAQSASYKAAAEALFDQGVKLLKKGQYDEACKKLERSQSVEPGIGTLL